MASYDYSITSLQSHLSMLRKLYGWTMEQFGDRIGVHQSESELLWRVTRSSQ